MSREELVSAYLAGGVSRRTFIRRLVAGGVSLGAAVSYAHLLAPGRASAQSPADFHKPATVVVKIRSRFLDKVVDSGKLKVDVTLDEPAVLEIFADAKIGGDPKPIGATTVDLHGPSTTRVPIPLDRAGRLALEDKDEVRVGAIVRAVDRQGQASVASATKKLKSG
jgi:hypothetical protein